MIILLIFYLILFTLLSWRKFDWAVALTIIFLPTYLIRFQAGFVPMTLLEAMIIILFISWLIKTRKDHEKIRFSNYKWGIFFLLICATIAIFIADDKIAALGVWKAYFIEPIMFFLVIINRFREKEKLRLIVDSLGISAMIVAIPAIVQKFSGFGIINEFWFAENTRRVTSWFGYPNAVGLFLGPIIGLYVCLLIIDCFNYKGRKALYSIGFKSLVIVLSLTAVLFAKSEGALIGIIASAIFVGMFYPNRRLRIAAISILIVCSAGILLTPSLRSYAINKIFLRDLSGQIRQQQWKETWEMISVGRQFTGAGLANYQNAVKPFHQEGIFVKDYNDQDWLKKVMFNADFRKKVWQPTEIYLYPHNIVLNFWSEIGLGGLLFIVWLLIRMLRNHWKVNKDENKKFYIAILAGMVVILVHGLVDVPYFKNDLSVMWWLFFGVSWVAAKAKKEV